ncbi:MAG: MFS transporter [Bacillaceae bacterium]|nr:MFS transporter [Bacillaceae bacterium]
MQQNAKLWTLPFVLLILGNGFTFMSFQMLIPTLPPYIEDIGATATQVGLVTTLFSIGAIIIRPYIGFLLESQTRKKLVLIGSLSLLLLTMVYPLTQIIFLLLFLRFIHGVAWGWSTTVNGTAGVDLVPRSRIGEGMGYFGLSATIGMIIAPSLGIFIFQNYSFNLLIMISAVLGTVGFILFSLTAFRTPEVVQNTSISDTKFSFFGSLIDKNSWYPAFVTLMTTFAYGSIITFLVIFGENRSIEHIFLFYLVNAIMATIFRPLSGRFYDLKGPWHLILGSSLIAFVAMWILVYAHNSWMLAIAGGLFGIGFGSMMPGLQAWVISKTTPERSGVANGMFYSSIDLGIGMSGILFGSIAQVFGLDLGTVFGMSSFFFLVVFLLTWVDYQKEKQKVAAG